MLTNKMRRELHLFYLYSLWATSMSLLGVEVESFERRRNYFALTAQIDETIPFENCTEIIKNFEIISKESSRQLFFALKELVVVESVNLIVPNSWPDYCIPENASSVTYDHGHAVDIKITNPHPSYFDLTWTQQSRPCSEKGDLIYTSYRPFQDKSVSNNLIGSILKKELIKYLFGVFDERGFINDTSFPVCYQNNENKDETLQNGCSEKAFLETSCNDDKLNTIPTNDEAFGSLLTSPSFKEVCDKYNHNRFAPNRQNFMCNSKSIMEVILPEIENKKQKYSLPSIVYRRKYNKILMVLIEHSEVMKYSSHYHMEFYRVLKNAVKILVMDILPSDVEVGLIIFNETDAYEVSPPTELQNGNIRSIIAGRIPLNVKSNSSNGGCIKCAIKLAVDVNQNTTSKSRVMVSLACCKVSITDLARKKQLVELYYLYYTYENNLGTFTKKGIGAVNIIIIASGFNESLRDIAFEINRATKMGIRVSAVTYPIIGTGGRDLSEIANLGNGYHTLAIEKLKGIGSMSSMLLSQLTDSLRSLSFACIQNENDIVPSLIHKKHIFINNPYIEEGSFIVHKHVTNRIVTYIFMDAAENNIESIKLISPSGKICDQKSEQLFLFKVMLQHCNIIEPGEWTYVINRLSLNTEQEDTAVIQIFGYVKKTSAFVTKTFFSSTLPILYTEVKNGDIAISNAKVSMYITKLDRNGEILYTDELTLLDTGTDADSVKDDGVYSAYYGAFNGEGLYDYRAYITDNGNSATTVSDEHMAFLRTTDIKLDENCCGSRQPIRPEFKLDEFVIYGRTVSQFIKEEYYLNWERIGKIWDLTGTLNDENLEIYLNWRAVYLNDIPVQSYFVYYGYSLKSALDGNYSLWNISPFNNSSKVQFYVMNLATKPFLIRKSVCISVAPLFLGINRNVTGPPSNWQCFFISGPPSSTSISSKNLETTTSIIVTTGNHVTKITTNIFDKKNWPTTVIIAILLASVLMFFLMWHFCRRSKSYRNESGSNEKSHNGLSPKEDKIVLSPSLLPSQKIPPESKHLYQRNQQYYQQYHPQQQNDYRHQYQQEFTDDYKEPDVYSTSHKIQPRDNYSRKGDHASLNSWSPTHIPIVRGKSSSISEDERYNSSIVSPAYNNGNTNYSQCRPNPNLLQGNNVYNISNGYQNQPTGDILNSNLSGVNFNLQGSLLSVTSTEKKRRNITMVSQSSKGQASTRTNKTVQ